MAEGNPGLIVRLATAEELAECVAGLEGRIQGMVKSELVQILTVLEDEAGKDQTIRELHSNLTKHTSGLVKEEILRPVVASLIRLADRIEARENAEFRSYRQQESMEGGAGALAKCHLACAKSLLSFKEEILNLLGEMEVGVIPTSGRYDRQLHIRIGAVSTGAETEAGLIARAVKKGYRLGNKVIRKAEVKVRELEAATTERKVQSEH